MQTQRGFEENLPGVRLSVYQRKTMMQEFENFENITESEPQEHEGPRKTLGEVFSNAVDQLVTMVD
jgi:hypothetical protein